MRLMRSFKVYSFPAAGPALYQLFNTAAFALYQFSGIADFALYQLSDIAVTSVL